MTLTIDKNFVEIKQFINLVDKVVDSQLKLENVKYREDIKDLEVRNVMFIQNVFRSVIAGDISKEVANYKLEKISPRYYELK